MHEIQSYFFCTAQCYRENMKSTNIGNLDNNEYYEYDYKCSMKNPLHEFMLNENTNNQAREIMDQEVNRKYEENLQMCMN